MKPRYVHIGSWNIEHFGRGDDTENNRYAIAEHIEMSGVDVLALQEMYVTEIGPDGVRRNRFLQGALELIEEHTGQAWAYELFPNRDPGDTSQLCGVAWNTARVTKEGPAYKIPVLNSVVVDGLRLSLWDRTPHAVKFRANVSDGAEITLTDFIVVPLHMKANVGHPTSVITTRHQEVATLMSKLSDIEDHFAGEKDVIFLGDTNCKSREELAILEFLGRKFEDLNEEDITTYAVGDSAPFDRIFIPMDEERKTFRFSRQYILRSASPFAHKKFLSDHYMVKTSIVVRRDDLA